MISYELSYATALAAVILLAGSLSLREVVDAQAGYWFGFIPRWYVFLQPVGFIIYMIAGVAETNRAPFDFPEAEQELVAGYNTEYSSVRFALFPQAEYINMTTMSAVATDLYLGGWHGPFLPSSTGWIWFLVKVGAILFLYIWVRWTVPRYRYDQLMQFGWKWLFPASVINLIRDGGAGAVFQCLRRWSSICSPAWRSCASALVIGQRNPMYSVLLLIASFGALAGLYIQLDAPFVAVAQIIIYAGAIMVLFLFVVMLLNAPQEDAAEWDRPHPLRQPGIARFGVAAGAAARRAARLGAADAAASSDAPVAAVPASRDGQLGAGARPGALHRLRVRVRGDVDPDPRGDGRRRRAGAAGRRAVVIPLSHYLIVSAMLFAIGTAGVFLRRNLITILLSIEIMLNAVNLTFVAFGR